MKYGVLKMEKIILIYWSGTGNTEAMAKKILEGLNSEGGTAKMVPVFEIDAKEALTYDKLVLGSPAMGLETLEQEEFEPFFEEIEDKLKGKKIALFGSYGWGEGEWMKNWEERILYSGATLFEEGLAVDSTPSNEEENECFNFGTRFLKF